MGRLWERLKDRNFYITVLIIVFGNMLLTSTVSEFIISKVNLSTGWLLDAISMTIITLILLIISMEVFEL